MSGITAKEVAVIRKDLRLLFRPEDGWRLRVYRYRRQIKHGYGKPYFVGDGKIYVLVVNAPYAYPHQRLVISSKFGNWKTMQQPEPYISNIAEIVMLRWKDAGVYDDPSVKASPSFHFKIFIGHPDNNFTYAPSDWKPDDLDEQTIKVKAMSLLAN